jgi:hypothetical protein
MHILAEAPACAEALAFAPERTKEWVMKLLIVEENAAMRRLIVLLAGIDLFHQAPTTSNFRKG